MKLCNLNKCWCAHQNHILVPYNIIIYDCKIMIFGRKGNANNTITMPLYI